MSADQASTESRRMHLRVFDTRFCHRCQCEREFSKRKPAHLWHLGLTIVTFGLWGVGWIAVAIAAQREPWRCSICRSRFRPSDKPRLRLGSPTPTRPNLPIEPRHTDRPRIWK